MRRRCGWVGWGEECGVWHIVYCIDVYDIFMYTHMFLIFIYICIYVYTYYIHRLNSSNPLNISWWSKHSTSFSLQIHSKKNFTNSPPFFHSNEVSELAPGDVVISHFKRPGNQSGSSAMPPRCWGSKKPIPKLNSSRLKRYLIPIGSRIVFLAHHFKQRAFAVKLQGGTVQPGCFWIAHIRNPVKC